MLKNRNTLPEPANQIADTNKEPGFKVDADMLRIRRELVNAAIEVVGYDPVKIEQYINRKNVA